MKGNVFDNTYNGATDLDQMNFSTFGGNPHLVKVKPTSKVCIDDIEVNFAAKRDN